MAWRGGQKEFDQGPSHTHPIPSPRMVSPFWLQRTVLLCLQVFVLAVAHTELEESSLASLFSGPYSSLWEFLLLDTIGVEETFST